MLKPDPRIEQKAHELVQWFDERKVETIILHSSPPSANLLNDPPIQEMPANVSVVFVLGGDGTFLNAVRWIGKQDIPVVGVKFGRIGFLSETTEEYLIPLAEAIFHKKYSIEKRMRLKATLQTNDQIKTAQYVLNDVVINKGTLARLASIQTYIDGHDLTTYKADGLIVSTPTGSTAYSLAAGGPVVHPALSAIMMTPICPFTLTNRPLIIPDIARIEIKMVQDSTDILVTFDGQTGLPITDQDRLLIEKADYPVSMIKMPDKNYFDVLKTKLRWSGGR
ncbi:MAG: NAD+ kinase [Candidatus Magnetoglobus multicellularis str. Araruama]|uniref:NAD kinase n=1 Tax=Candidatus Magnetoglobus multicellularis str. Araruama TaxID=890399 RepID=A0A1V1PH48_9BACT|nr:MAG: NAD+ kinase [Candidatus Magnetoglobus multicellularis str. Araruama]